ncbi:hypothetical protein FACS189483_06410 [Spirochaetia bacterium]|nr:hypothetical protein FACS189483_06410 [Spirochaetia bacterium]
MEKHILMQTTPPPRGIDIIHEWQYTKKRFFSAPFYTLCIDLTESEEVIFSRFAKNTKYEINRAMKQDGIESITIDMAKGKKAFYDFFDEFANTKNLHPINRDEIDLLAAHDMFVIRAALYKGEVIVYHTYITVNGRARLAQSASLFRESTETDFRNIAGRANRLLHWEDMRYFKAQNYKTYDLGGINKALANKETQAINKFKECFGGIEVMEYKSLVPVSVKGFIYLFYKWITGRIAY